MSSVYPKWAWEQGRMQYFKFQNIRRMARAITELENVPLDNDTVIRGTMKNYTDLPFKPVDYKLWRNYGRVVKCCLLGARINNRLAATDVCQRIIDENHETRWEVDEYFAFLIPRFSYPFPAFRDYNISQQRVFPLCAILKYLIGSYVTKGEASISELEVYSVLIGNEVTGHEDFALFQSLQPTRMQPVSDQGRQVREMMIFLGQVSFLNWIDSRLHIDIDNSGVIQALIDLSTPKDVKLLANPDASVLALATIDNDQLYVIGATNRLSHEDFAFTEGKRVRTNHLRIERSNNLRSYFLRNSLRPVLCDMCHVNNDRRYPWTQNLIEIHHLLPLASSVEIDRQRTSLRDIVPLCPSCHRSIHVYYRNWLKGEGVDDFNSRDESLKVYNDAKKLIWLGQ